MKNKRGEIETTEVSSTEVIMPLKDHIIVHNEFKYHIKKGEEIEVDKRFIYCLKQEKVIN